MQQRSYGVDQHCAGMLGLTGADITGSYPGAVNKQELGLLLYTQAKQSTSNHQAMVISPGCNDRISTSLYIMTDIS